MRKIWALSLVFIAMIGLPLCCFYGLFTSATDKMKIASVEYSRKTLANIFITWDPKVFEEHASPELLKREPETSRKKLLNDLKSKLGRFSTLQQIQHKGFNRITVQGKEHIISHINAEATFEKGKAIVEMRVVGGLGGWKIGSFFVKT